MRRPGRSRSICGMALGLDRGRVYSVIVRRHAPLLDDPGVALSDLEFVQPNSLDELGERTLTDLEFVGRGRLEGSNGHVLVFIDRTDLEKGYDSGYRVIRESEVVAAEPMQASK